MFAEARLSDEVLGVRDEYLDGGAGKTSTTNYGSLDAYLRDGGVAPPDRRAARRAVAP